MFAKLRAQDLHSRYRPAFPVDVDSLCRREGVFVLPVQPELIHGLAGVSHQQVILVSTSLPPWKRRWTLAHELHHVLADAFDQTFLYRCIDVRADQLEYRAEAFARELLMPADEMRRVFAERWTVTAVLRHFGVPLWALLARCRDEVFRHDYYQSRV